MEDKQYKELTDFIGSQFQQVWGGFDSVENRFDFVENRLDSLEFKFDDLKKDFRQLQSAVDAYAHKADIYFQELLALSTKVDRLERWINQLAEKAGVKLS